MVVLPVNRGRQYEFNVPKPGLQGEVRLSIIRLKAIELVKAEI